MTTNQYPRKYYVAPTNQLHDFLIKVLFYIHMGKSFLGLILNSGFFIESQHQNTELGSS